MAESLFSPEFEAVMAKYELTIDFTNYVGSIKAIVDKAWALDAEIQAAKSSESGTVKVANHPYDVKASKDKAAAAKAAELLKAFITACDVAINKNRSVAWHLQNLGGSVTDFFTYEVQYSRVKVAPSKPATSNSKLDTLKEDRKVLKQGVETLIKPMPGMADMKNADGEYLFLRNDDGTIKLPNLQGAGTRTAESPTGRWAKYLQEVWVIDDKELPVGTDPREMVRMIWPPEERAAHKPGEIFEAIDAARKAEKDSKTPVSVTINGHTVSYKIVDQKESTTK